MAKSEKFKLSLGLSAMLIVLGMVFVFVYLQLPVKAALTDSIGGWGWSANTGWISMNCDNMLDNLPPDDTCNNLVPGLGGSSDYGVDANLITGEITGYAWSEHLGWISFESADLLNCPTAPCEASVEWTDSYEVSGWARIYNDPDGWISLNCASTDDNCSSSDYKVIFNDDSYEFEGWAYEPEIAGWISFNCNNPESDIDICNKYVAPWGGPSNYQVYQERGYGIPPVADFEFCKDPTDEINFFDTSTDPIKNNIIRWYWEIDDVFYSEEQYPPQKIFSSGNYNVRLTVQDSEFNKDSTEQWVDPDNPFTTPSCEFDIPIVYAQACELVDLQWEETMGDETYEIFRCVGSGVNCDQRLEFEYRDTVPAGTCSFGTCDWSDNAAYPGRTYNYYVIAERLNDSSLGNSDTSINCSGQPEFGCPMEEETPSCVATGLQVDSACRENRFEWQTISAPEGHNVYASIVEPNFPPVLGQDKIVASTFWEYPLYPYCPDGCFDLGSDLFYTDNDVLSDVTYYYTVEVITLDENGIDHIVGEQQESASGTPRCYRGPVYIEQ